MKSSIIFLLLSWICCHKQITAFTTNSFTSKALNRGLLNVKPLHNVHHRAIFQPRACLLRQMEMMMDTLENTLASAKPTRATNWCSYSGNLLPKAPPSPPVQPPPPAPVQKAPWPEQVNIGLADCYENEKEFSVHMDLPGVHKRDITVSLDNDAELHITARRNDPLPDDKQRISERFIGDIARLILLPTNVNTDKIRASLANGVLVITCPKK